MLEQFVGFKSWKPYERKCEMSNKHGETTFKLWPPTRTTSCLQGTRRLAAAAISESSIKLMFMDKQRLMFANMTKACLVLNDAWQARKKKVGNRMSSDQGFIRMLEAPVSLASQ